MPLRPPKEAEMDKIRTVVVGAGYFAAEVHLPAMKANGDLDIVAICRRNVDLLKPVAERFGIPRMYGDYKEMIDKEKPDAVIVITSIAATAEVATYAMEKGIPTLLEKPPASTVEEARKLVEVADRTGTINIVAFNRRHALPIVRAKKLIDDEGLKIRTASAKMLRYRRFDKEFVSGTGIHSIDTLRYLAGDIVEVDTFTAPPSDKEGGSNAFVVLKYESGAHGVFSVNSVCGISYEAYEVHTEGSSMFIKLPQGGFGAEDCGFTYWRGPTYPLKSLNADMISPYVRPQMMTGIYEESAALVECIRENRKSPNDVLDGLKSMLVCDAIRKGGHQVVEKV